VSQAKEEREQQAAIAREKKRIKGVLDPLTSGITFLIL
jgi:hypothetical protein